MRNQPHSQWQVIDASAERREEAWSLDRQVELRTWVLGVLAFLVMLGITARVAELKLRKRDNFLAQANPTTTETEPLPAIDGSIVSSDGQLLAYDHEDFSVSVHYRWLEEPPDPRWLKQEAKSIRAVSGLVDNDDDPEKSRQLVLERRNEMWQRLSAAGGISLEEFEERRAEIQERIEQIAETVNSARKRKFDEKRDERERPRLESYTDWDGWWELLQSELTEPPLRDAGDPITIREELDYHPILKQVPTRVITEIESHPATFPGVRIVPETTRIYPGGSLASHVIGLRSRLQDDQIRERQQELNGNDPLAYHSGDRQGRFGVERTYDTTLRGIPGERRIVRSRDGSILEQSIIRESLIGKQLVISLDSRLQQVAEQLLDRLIPSEPSLIPPLPAGARPIDAPEPQGGCIVVMNVYSGELLAAASSPRPNLRRLAEGSSDYWQQVTADKRAPLLSRLTQVRLAPGSTFKPVTAAAILETPGGERSQFSCQGFLDDPFEYRCAIFQSAAVGHGPIDLEGALAQSCNVYFFDAARRLGTEPMVEWPKRLGFGRPTGVDLPFEQSGHVPSPKDNQDQKSRKWYPGDLLGVAIGQSYLTVTPLQMVSMMAAIANGGELVSPRVVTRIVASGAGALTTDSVPPVETKPIKISQSTLSRIRNGLEQTVANEKGTAHKTVFLPQVAIAGKTGTAQTGGDKAPHAWFLGYVPANEPRYAFVVMLENAGSGGKVAGPLARELVKSMLEFGMIAPASGPNSSGM